MNNPPRPWLLAISLFALLPSAAPAQFPNLRSGGPPLYPISPPKQSHHDLPTGPELNPNGDLMAERLKELHELHDLQDQVRGLLQDPDFVNNVKNNFSPEQLRQLREKILQGKGLAGDGNWNKLLDQAVSWQKLDERQLDILRRWAERSANRPTNTAEHAGLLDGRSSPASPGSPASVPSPAEASPVSANGSEPSLWQRLQEGTTNWIGEHLDGIAGDFIGALAELADTEDGAPLAELLRNIKQPDLSDTPLIEEVANLSRYMPEVGNFLHEQQGAWDQVRSIFHNVPTPSLPRIGGDPSTFLSSSPSSADGEGWVTGLLALLVLGAMLLLVWRRAGQTGRGDTGAETAAWKLGSWPVRPNAITSRADLIRAFEYLALLCLGVAANTRHHRELAGRLAEREADDAARRRQAADLLADLYEQARYAPASEALSLDELSNARQALCFLAGVTTV